MSRRSSSRRPPVVARAQASVLDRIFDRLRDAPDGFHEAAAPADAAAIAASGLPEAERELWLRFDGLSLATGEATIFALAALGPATAQARAAGVIAEGDLVIGEQGRDTFVLPADPWAEGAAVVRVEEAGDRSPEASSVAHLVLGWLGEMSVLYDEHGEFREALIGDDGELEPAAARKLLRRRLDHDPDAPNARLRLAELLRRNAEFDAARTELRAVLRRAPEFAWAHHELGRVTLELGDLDRARASFVRAGECAPAAAQRAFHLAWAARAAEGEERAALARQVLALRPEFAAHQALAADACLDDDRPDAAIEQIELGLAVVPGHLELLRLRGTTRTDA